MNASVRRGGIAALMSGLRNAAQWRLLLWWLLALWLPTLVVALPVWSALQGLWGDSPQAAAIAPGKNLPLFAGAIGGFDEKLGGIYVANAIARLADPLSAVLVFDGAAWQGPGRSTAVSPNPALVANGATVHRAEMLAALADKIGVPAPALQETVSRYNDALAAGCSERLDPCRSTHRYAPMPIRVAPFYAVPVCAGITYTMGGVAIDADGRVLRADGTVLPGLYAAGSTTTVPAGNLST